MTSAAASDPHAPGPRPTQGPSWEDVVRVLYEAVLRRREVADEEVATWAAHLRAGASLRDVYEAFATSPEAHRVQGTQPSLRRRDAIAPLQGWVGLAAAGVVTIVDVGALALEGEDDVYRPLLDGGRCRVIGFEPLEEERASRPRRPDGFEVLPHLLGDGRRRRFHETHWGPTSSLYEPDLERLAPFEDLAEQCRVAAVREVPTTTLDDALAGATADYLKIDVQGAELDVLRGAEATLADTLALHVEVEFAPLYRAQPLFDAVFRFLVDRGFELFDLTHLQRYRYNTGDDGTAPERLLWGEAVFVPEQQRLDALDEARTLRLVRILHEVYGATGFCRWLLGRLDGRLGTAHLDGYRAHLDGAESR